MDTRLLDPPVQLLKRWSRRRRTSWVVAVFVLEPTTTPLTTSGDDEPMVGVVATEDEARQVQATHPEVRVRWEDLRLYTGSESPGKTVIVAVEGGFFTDTAVRSPSPLAVFTTMQGAAAWARMSGVDDSEVLFWEVLYGGVRMPPRPWPGRRLDEAPGR